MPAGMETSSVFFLRTAVAAAVGAGVLDEPLAAAGVAGPHRLHHAERRALVDAHLTAAAAGRTGLGLAALLRAAAAAGRAFLRALERNLLLTAERRLEADTRAPMSSPASAHWKRPDRPEENPPPKKLPKMSLRSKSIPPPKPEKPPPAPKLGSTPAWPYWSYCARFSLSETTE